MAIKTQTKPTVKTSVKQKSKGSTDARASMRKPATKQKFGNAKTANRPNRSTTKQEQIIVLLKRANGATLAEIGKVTDWQGHSIRGFMSGTLKKRLGLTIQSSKDGKGERRYRIFEETDEEARERDAKSGKAQGVDEVEITSSKSDAENGKATATATA